ncbi:MAG: deoxyguanosinetriphosphate triphosphohydrolase [Oscillospiraceae bacterium]|nr:deoxyguanosinetriphosphate triphosphohydrolase [Oscillospiraceae bacterium]
MTIREEMERAEHTFLAPWAAFSDQTKGRLRPEEESEVRTCYQRDVDRIVYSKAFRRMKHKTQVFLQPEGDHYRTRLTHTLEVMRISRTIARALRLNEDLTEAIAFGHDLGHTPFGHAGEKALREITGKPFHHNEQSLRVVDLLEKDGEGLNLCYETRMGIVGHTGERIPETLEGQIVRMADRIAYINHDIDDARRAGILRNEDIPRNITDLLGLTHSERINTLVMDIIECSREKNSLERTPEIAQAMEDLRDFMFERVYRNPVAKGEEHKAKDIIGALYEHYISHPDDLPADFQPQLSFDGIERTVLDYIAGMTDKYAVYKFSEIFIPTAWQVRG